MLKLRSSVRYLTLLPLLICSSGIAHAQASCDVFGSPTAYVGFQKHTDVLGGGRSTEAAMYGKGLVLKPYTRAYLNTLPVGSTNKLTLAMWVLPKASPTAHTQQRFISQASGVEPAQHDLMVSTEDYTRLRFRLRIGFTTQELTTPKKLLTVGRWSHIAVTYNGSQMQIYHNGALSASKNVTGQMNLRPNKIGIGNQPLRAGNRPFVGTIDELVVFDSALTAANIRSLRYSQGLNCGWFFSNQTNTVALQTSAAAQPQAKSSISTVAQPKTTANTTTSKTTTTNTVVNTTPLSSNLPVYTGNNWPATNDKLMMGGIFYGATSAGMTTGNSGISNQNSIRFRAQRTGSVKAIRYNNRTLTKANIDQRCAASSQTSVWCKCNNAGLTAQQCGYTLSNSYSVGTGGLITIEVRDNDNSAQNFPGSRTLGTTNAFTPTKVKSKYPTINLKNPVYLEAGKIYHLVFRNDKAPTKCRLRGLTPAQAKTCGSDRGTISINGTQHAVDPTSLHHFGPFLGTAGHAILGRKNASQPWEFREGVTAFYEVQYTDGKYVGESYAGYDNRNNSSSKGTRFIDGNNRARQVFTVNDATRRVNGIWLNYGHSQTKATNGKALQVQVKSASGAVLATGSIPANRTCSNIATKAFKAKVRITTRLDWMCRTWGYTDLSKIVTLTKGKKYYVEYSAASGAAFALSSYFSYHGKEDVNMWTDARAERSTNAGKSWAEWSGMKKQITRDLPMMFTIVGMPKQLP